MLHADKQVSSQNQRVTTKMKHFVVCLFCFFCFLQDTILIECYFLGIRSSVTNISTPVLARLKIDSKLHCTKINETRQPYWSQNWNMLLEETFLLCVWGSHPCGDYQIAVTHLWISPWDQLRICLSTFLTILKLHNSYLPQHCADHKDDQRNK